MQIIKIYPKRLDRLINDASKKTNKEIVVRKNPVLSLKGSQPPSHVISFPENIEKSDQITIDISLSQHISNIRDNLTPNGEIAVARSVVDILAYFDGYKHNRLYGKIVINKDPYGPASSYAIQELMHNGMINAKIFALNLVSHSYLNEYGYDIHKEIQGDRLLGMLSIVQSKAIVSDAGIAAHANIQKLVLFERARILTELYLLMPAYMRNEMLKDVPPHLKNEVFSLINYLKCDFDQDHLKSPEFRSYYTPGEYVRTIKRLYEYLGDENNIFILPMNKQDYEMLQISQALQALFQKDLYMAFNMLINISNPEASRLSVITAKRLMEQIYLDNQYFGICSSRRYLAHEFIKRGMVRSALYFQEEADRLEEANKYN